MLGIEEGNPYFDLTLTKGKGTVVVSSAMAFYVFMDLESARDLFGESDDFYNVLFSDEALDIPAGPAVCGACRSHLCLLFCHQPCSGRQTEENDSGRSTEKPRIIVL